MGGRSKITRVDPAIRARVDKRKQRKDISNVQRGPYRARLEQLLREAKFTFDELEDIIRGEFPDAKVSRSSIYRYAMGLQEMTERMREIDHASRALVGEFGDSLGEKASTLLANSVITLVTDASLKQQNEEVDIESIRKLARAAKDAIDTKRMDVNVRKAVAQEAREALLREQTAKLDKVVKSGGLSAETAADFRKKILGIG